MAAIDHETVLSPGAFLKLIASGEVPDRIPAELEFGEELGLVCNMLRHYREELEQLELKLSRETAFARVLQNSKQLYKDIFINAVTGIMIVTEQGKILDANYAVETMLGYSISDLTRYNLSDIAIPDGQQDDAELIRDLIEGKRTYFNLEKRYVRSDGIPLWVMLTVFAVVNDFKTPYIIMMFEDISARKTAELHLEHVSTHDSLTGLYNRTHFDSEFNRLQNGLLLPVSIVIVDLDGLKTVNDTAGHDAGDYLIISVARVLSEAVGTEGILARIGGDEFAALLPRIGQDAAQQIVQRIRSCQHYFNQANPRYAVDFSIGTATAHRGGDIPKAFKHADAQMYADKMMRKAAMQKGREDAAG